MTLLIDNKPAAIKDGSSFDYTSDNRLFNDRDDYTMSIELPLDCKENAAIFGDIHRKEADIDNIYFDAEIIADNFHKSGAVVIVSITETMAKVQFIAGRSFQNFYPGFDNTYIDELELGAIPNWLPNNKASASGGGTNRNDRPSTRPGANSSRDDHPQTSTDVSPATAWGTGDIIALPWVNATSGNIQNKADYGYYNGTYQWVWHVVQNDDDDTELVKGLSCQARLYYLAQLICTALGYEFNASPWQDSEYYYLYSFNAVPYAWGGCNWEDTLPHWSVNEFFENLEKLMLCEFDINHKEKTINFSWSNDNVVNAGTVAIDNVVDEFTASVSKDDDSQYRGMKNIGYADGGHNMSNIYSCDWYFRKEKVWVTEFDTLLELVTYLNSKPRTWFQGEAIDMIFHCKDVDNYFIPYVTGRYLFDRQQHSDVMKYLNTYKILPLNAYGNRIFDDQKWDEKEEIGIVPAWLDETDLGFIPFFEAGELDNVSTSGEQYKTVFDGHETPNSKGDVEPDQILQSTKFRIVKEGDNDGKTNYSTLQVGFWYGMGSYYFGLNELPHPFLDEYEVMTDAVVTSVWYQQLFSILNTQHHGSLRLNSDKYGQGKLLTQTITIDNKKKYEFSFLSDQLPDVRARFIIRGKKYLCSSIKAEITENGMSTLKKGTFWRILE